MRLILSDDRGSTLQEVTDDDLVRQVARAVVVRHGVLPAPILLDVLRDPDPPRAA